MVVCKHDTHHRGPVHACTWPCMMPGLVAEGLGQPQVAGYRQDMLVLNGKT
jgi:hypothetical protein